MMLLVSPDGEVRCLYGEEIDLSLLGSLALRRASHVEPDADGKWWVDLSPVGGCRQGPFERRSAALAAEQSWLETHWLTRTTATPTPVS